MTCIALIWKSTSSKEIARVVDGSAGVVVVQWWCSGRLMQRIALVLALTAENRSGFLDAGRLGMQCDRLRLGYTNGQAPKGQPGPANVPMYRERGHA